MNYFVVTENNRLNCFYYGADRSIYQRIYENKKWSRAFCVISDVRRHYSVAVDSEPVLICQEKNGDIAMCHAENDVWQNKIILESRTLNAPDMRMQRFKNSLFYNISQDGTYMLVMQMQDKGKWQRPKAIDRFIPFGSGIFYMTELADGRAVLIYRKNTPKQQIGFRLADQNCNIGDFKSVYTTNGMIQDFSMVYSNGFLHFVIAVKNGFSSRLIYIRSAEEAVERKNTVLWEGNNIENAVIRADQNKMTVKCGAGRRYYTFISSENGFKGIDVSNVGERMKKAYICGGKLGCNDIIVPADRPYDIDVSLLGINE